MNDGGMVSEGPRGGCDTRRTFFPQQSGRVQEPFTQYRIAIKIKPGEPTGSDLFQSPSNTEFPNTEPSTREPSTREPSTHRALNMARGIFTF